MRHGAAEKTSSGKVLVVDDEPMILDVATMILEGEGYTVATARSAIALSDLVMQEAPDVVLLDVGLPGLKGHLAVQAVRSGAAGERARVILYSGECEEELQHLAARTGADFAVAKASGPQRLVEAIHQAMSYERSTTRSAGGE
jgi:two-component system, OmpR family, KDP operon response regulator KdpE